MLSEEKFKKVKLKINKIDSEVKEISGNSISNFFDELSLTVAASSSEAGFIKLVAVLYVILHEGHSKINFDFVIDKFDSYGLDTSKGKKFKVLCHHIRTFFQHNLNLKSKSDLEKYYTFLDWLNKVCSKNKIDQLTEEDWEKCFDELLKQFENILDDILEVLLKIGDVEEEFKQIILEDWTLKLNAFYPIYRFHSIATKVVVNFGQNSIDIYKFCAIRYDQWVKEIKNFKDFEFEELAQRLIERDFLVALENNTLPLPINGNDIISHFKLKPGREVQTLLQQAKEIYSKRPCSAEELLKMLKV